MTLHISHMLPKPAENWLAAPAEPFYLALRLYLPGRVHEEHRYTYSAIEMR